jgi:hypothetical protein
MWFDLLVVLSVVETKKKIRQIQMRTYQNINGNTAAESTKWTRSELLDLLQHEPLALVLVLNLVVFVHDDEEVCFFVAGVGQELFSRECEVVLGGDDEYDDVNLFLPGKERSGFETVAVQAWGIDEGNVETPLLRSDCEGACVLARYTLIIC